LKNFDQYPPLNVRKVTMRFSDGNEMEKKSVLVWNRVASRVFNPSMLKSVILLV